MQSLSGFLVLFVLLIHFIAIRSDPSFGNEYVHIKVHVPKDEANVDMTATPENLHPPTHKVIHHYHHRRRRKPARKLPTQKNKENALIESLILSDLSKPNHADHVKYLNHANDIAQQFTESPKPKKKVETYRIVEEFRKPAEPVVETFKLVENHVPSRDHQPHEYHSAGIADSVAITESKYASHSQHGPYEYAKHNREEFNYEDRPPTSSNSVKIETQYQTQDAADEDTYEYRPKYSSQTVEITESKEPLRHFTEEQDTRQHHYYDERKYYSPSESYGPPASRTYDTPRDSYGPPPSRTYSPPTDTYLPPASKTHSTPLDSYGAPPSKSYEAPSETYLPPKTYKPPSEKYGTPSTKTYSPITKEVYESSKPYEIPSETYMPPRYKQVPFRTSSYSTMPESYATHTPSTERLMPPYRTPSDNYLSPHRDASSHSHNHREESNHRQNTIYDDEYKTVSSSSSGGYSYRPPPLATTRETSIDWPTENYHAAETYKGSDSYSVPHVQGLGSGGYRYSA